jgi:hypothetical protein
MKTKMATCVIWDQLLSSSFTLDNQSNAHLSEGGGDLSGGHVSKYLVTKVTRRPDE